MAASGSALPNNYQLGEYIIESVLGKGGFGVTYLARDSKLGARVAIKEYFPHSLAMRDGQMAIAPKSADANENYKWGLDQFLKEAQALARFKHNNIVRVLRFLELNGTAYMVMEYEEGEGLAEYLKKHNGRLDEPMLLQIFLPVLNGLQAVHSAGLLHLDIKPDNIYIRSDGTPILIDFGSARQTARGPDAEDRIALTPAYAAIEQYPDKGKQGPWTDIYSIGASMYHCITGKPPLDAMNRYKTILKYKADPQTPATKLKQEGYSNYIRECIDWASAVYPSHRPKGALQLQEGLMGQGRPGKKQSQARVTPNQNQDKKPVEEKLTLSQKTKHLDMWKVSQGIMVILVIAAGATTGMYYLQTRNIEHVAPVTTRSDTEYTAEEAEAYTREAIKKAEAMEAVKSANVEPPPVFDRNYTVQLVRTLVGHQSAVHAVAFIANGKQLASASQDGTIRIWDAASGKLVTILRGHKRSVHTMAVSPDGRILVSAGNEEALFLWNMRTGKKIGTLTGHDYDVYTMQFSADGKWLASAGKDQEVIIWDVDRRQPIKRLSGHQDTILSVAFSPDRSLLISGGKDGQMKYWTASSGKEKVSIGRHQGLVSAVSYSPNGKWIASAGKRDMLRLWSTKSGEQERSMTGALKTTNTLLFTPDSKQLIGGGTDNTIRIWDVRTGQIDHELSGHRNSILSIALSPDNNTIASADSDGLVQIWQVTKK